MRESFCSRVLKVLGPALLVLCVFLAAAPPPVSAKMDSKEWKEVAALYNELFKERGNAKGKAQVLQTIASDGTGRAWRLMADALFREVELWWSIKRELNTAATEQAEIGQRSTKGFTADDENRTKDLQQQMRAMEIALKDENEALAAVLKVLVEGPVALRTNIIRRAKGGGEWPHRAAAVRVAVATMNEPGSWTYLQNAIENDEDPRVRLEGLHAIGTAEEKWEDLVIGRLGDGDWGVVLMAARIAKERGLRKAVPHLINALGSAGPRVGEAIGDALRELTGENFESSVEVWSKWWQEHKAEFNSKVKVKKGKQKPLAEVHIYGVPVKSDNVLFIIDISSSMKLPTKNDNPMERWKPPPTVTGPTKRPPPPPPPEEILSGPKIDVAKHELKKGVKKLPKDAKFNIIKFNQAAVYWQKTMVPATDKNKAAALKWVRQLKPHGSTYIDGALRLGFKMAGLLGAQKKYGKVHVDTMILIADGAPTDNSFPISKLMDPELILEHVREWNAKQHVVIHAIGVDMVEGIEFMKKLAAQNGGTYVDR